jgi:iron complex outermembrane receptor protein
MAEFGIRVRRGSLRVLKIALLAGAVGVPGLALAQQTTDIDAVIVTAQKHESRLLDTPMSLTVVTDATLQATGADTFADFAKFVPGLSFTDSGPGNKRYALRGLQSAGEPEVALYYDDIPISGIPGGSLDTGDSQPDIKLWDVERIEVLQGPQGTLYGNGSMGGAIRIISKRPVLGAFQATAEASGSVTDGGRPSDGFSGMLNLPVGDRLAVRLTAYDRNEGGWIDNIASSGIDLPQLAIKDENWEHTTGGRGSFLFEAAPHWTLTGVAYYQMLDTGASFETYPSFATGGDRYVSKTYVRTPWHDESQMYGLTSTSDFGWANLVATGSYQKRDVDRATDTTRFLFSQFGCTEFTWNSTCFGPGIVPAASVSAEAVEAWSGEARLASQSSGPLQWTLGAFVQRSSTFRRGQVATTDAAGNVQYDADGNAIGRLFARNNEDHFNQAAVFGEGVYAITPQLSATVGLRWFDSDRSDNQVLVQQFFPGQPVGPQGLQTFKENDLFKKFELSYRFDGAGLVYAEAAQGFRAGGPNFPGGFNISAPPYRSDSVWDYELGWKRTLCDKRLYWDAAIFDIEWTNLQELVPTALFSYIANAGSARSQGFETEVSFVPAEGWALNANLAYNNAHLVGAQPITSPDIQLRSGDRLANAPQWTFNQNLSYRRALGGGYELSSRLGVSFQSSRGNMVATQNPAFAEIKASTLVDGHLALESASRWGAGVDVANLFDSFAEQSAKPLDSNLIGTITAARPRTVTLRIWKSF